MKRVHDRAAYVTNYPKSSTRRYVISPLINRVQVRRTRQSRHGGGVKEIPNHMTMNISIPSDNIQHISIIYVA